MRLYARGVGLGRTEVKLTDKDGKVEIIEIEVRRELALPVGIVFHLQMPAKKAIAKAKLDAEKIARVSVNDKDQTTAVIETVDAGQTSLQLADADGKAHAYHLVVRTPTLWLSAGTSTGCK
jgi:hypothetical protein